MKYIRPIAKANEFKQFTLLVPSKTGQLPAKYGHCRIDVFSRIFYGQDALPCKKGKPK